MTCLGSGSQLLPISLYNPATIGTGNAGAKRFNQIFSNTDLNNGVLTVNHNLDSVLVNVIVLKPISNGVYSPVIPNNINIYNHDSVFIDLSYFPVTTGWLVLVEA